jgi:uncharacterized membrane protein HdeD (DUF308 family)
MKYEQEIVHSHPSPYHFDKKRMLQNSIYIGLTIALFMASFFAAAKMFVTHIPAVVHYGQYLLIFGFVNIFLVAQKHNTGYKEPFVAKNFISGAASSAWAAVFFFILQSIIFQLLPGATVAENTGTQEALGTTPTMVFALMAVETFVLGMLSTFIAFQYLRRPPRLSKTT